MSRDGRIIIMTASDYVNSGVILSGGDSERNPLPPFLSKKNSGKQEYVAAATAIMAAASGHKVLSSTMTYLALHAFLAFAKAKPCPI